MIRIRDISLVPGADEGKLTALAEKRLGAKVTALKIHKKSIDARRKRDVRIIYTVDVSIDGDEEAVIARAEDPKVSIAATKKYAPPCCARNFEHPPIVAGFGPAGMFATLVLALAGCRPIVIERGSDVDARREKVEKFWSGGGLDEECNVQFGEGGAGTFSDGKLNTGTKNERIGWVLEQLVAAGAQQEILTDVKPHVGTDVLSDVVRGIRERIIALGAQVRFDTKLTDIVTDGGAVTAVRTVCGGVEEEIECSALILAVGHSARDTFEMLHEKGVPMAPKGFSMGVRIEHRQREIDRAQYGDFAELLPPADYKLNCRLPDGNSAYTFCMCPGGYVVAAASEKGGVVTNGMSLSGRDGANANAALLVTLQPEDFPYDGALGGMRWQREIERAAFEAAGGDYRAPAQSVDEFLHGKECADTVEPTYRPGVVMCDLRRILPEKITETIRQALPLLGRKLAGFDFGGAVMTAPETRSSSPVRILRDGGMQSELRGLYPCGEGAGYAGGIVSAAVDGIRCAEAVMDSPLA